MTEHGESAARPLTGGCLCGEIRYRATGPFRDVIACHCEQCRRASGHHLAATAVPKPGFEILSDETLRWFESSPGVRRGFCGRCGSNLFWMVEESAHVSIFAGTLDQPTGLRLIRHIYCADKADYYEIEDGLPADDGANRGQIG